MYLGSGNRRVPRPGRASTPGVTSEGLGSPLEIFPQGGAIRAWGHGRGHLRNVLRAGDRVGGAGLLSGVAPHPNSVLQDPPTRRPEGCLAEGPLGAPRQITMAPGGRRGSVQGGSPGNEPPQGSLATEISANLFSLRQLLNINLTGKPYRQVTGHATTSASTTT